MLGDSARNWYLILGCAAVAVALGRFLMTMLSNDPALYLAVAFIGSVAFLAFLGSIILFLGEAAKRNKTFLPRWTASDFTLPALSKYQQLRLPSSDVIAL